MNPQTNDQLRAKGERVTASGIKLPDRDEGHPIVILQTDVTGLQFNVAIDHEDDPDAVRQLARSIRQAQLDNEFAGDAGLIEFTEPQFGLTCYLTPRGATHITAVTPGYARIIDPLAGRPRSGNGKRLHLP